MRRLFAALPFFFVLSLLSNPNLSAQGQSYTESVLHSFCADSSDDCSTTDGYLPYASLVEGADGNFYGTNTGGGANSEGTIFKISQSGVVTVLYNFCSQGGSSVCSDGDTPVANLVLGGDGSFYGTTVGGNFGFCGGCGTLFKITPSGTFTLLYQFCTQDSYCSDGLEPYGSLVEGTDGDFYGTTVDGGANSNSGIPNSGNAGTIFKISSSGIHTILYSFCSQIQNDNCVDGRSPVGGLVQGSDGNFYGTTEYGGVSCTANRSTVPGCGTIYRITPSGSFSVLYSFSGSTDGAFPATTLVQGSDGDFYGATVYNYGTFFKVTPSGTLSTLHTFDDSDGYIFSPNQLTLGADGNYYGSTQTGGEVNGGLGPCNAGAGCGTVFKMTPSGTLTTIYDFCEEEDGGNCADGDYPMQGITIGSDGSIYGATQGGGGGTIPSNGGTVYKLSSTQTLAPPVALSLSKSSIDLGQSVTISWSVANAYSDTLQQCYAFVPAGGGTWAGLQTGTFNSTKKPPYSGTSAAITPTVVGTYTYALTCGGTETGLATLTVLSSGGGKSSSSTALAATPNPASEGQSVTLKATVSGSGTTPTGTVTFSAAGVALATINLNSSGVASFAASTSGIAPGAYPVIATYSGDSTYNSSKSSTDNVNLTKAPTSVTLTASPTSVTPPGNVAFTISVQRTASGTTGTPTGSVTLLVGTESLITLPLASGQAYFATSTNGVAPGKYSVSAKYGGDSNDSASASSAVSVTVQ